MVDYKDDEAFYDYNFNPTIGKQCKYCQEPIKEKIGHASFDVVDNKKVDTFYHKHCWHQLMYSLRKWARLFPAGTRNYGT